LSPIGTIQGQSGTTLIRPWNDVRHRIQNMRLLLFIRYSSAVVIIWWMELLLFTTNTVSAFTEIPSFPNYRGRRRQNHGVQHMRSTTCSCTMKLHNQYCPSPRLLVRHMSQQEESTSTTTSAPPADVQALLAAAAKAREDAARLSKVSGWSNCSFLCNKKKITK
jgi:hypothetical protein